MTKRDLDNWMAEIREKRLKEVREQTLLHILTDHIHAIECIFAWSLDIPDRRQLDKHVRDKQARVTIRLYKYVSDLPLDHDLFTLQTDMIGMNDCFGKFLTMILKYGIEDQSPPEEFVERVVTLFRHNVEISRTPKPKKS